MGGVTHTDVAAYVLGVLDDADRVTFEAHLIDCPHCQLDLLEMYDLPEILTEIGKYWPEPPIPQPRALDGMLDALAEQRIRRRRIAHLAIAVAIVLIIAGPLVTLALRAGAGGESYQASPPVATGTPQPLNVESTPATSTSASLFSGGQSASSLQAQVVIQTTTWGSQVDLILSGLAGPQQCSLMAVPWAGPEQTVTTWSMPVPAAGDLSQPLRISGGTALTSSDIARFEIRANDGSVLATIPR
ncbi:MAG TPA: zf-HC2 domain-containing protein [Amycolatopsis sp.]|nr:zf-HC2 domain-containing protein [Amycolatopsis sp.]